MGGETQCSFFKLDAVFPYQIGNAVESGHRFFCLYRFDFRPYKNMTCISQIAFTFNELNNMETKFSFNNSGDSIFSETECRIGIWFFKFTTDPESYFTTVFCTFWVLRIHNCQDIKTFPCKDLTSNVEQLLTSFGFIIFIIGWVGLNEAYFIFCRNNREAVLWERIIKLLKSCRCDCGIFRDLVLDFPNNLLFYEFFLYIPSDLRHALLKVCNKSLFTTCCPDGIIHPHVQITFNSIIGNNNTIYPGLIHEKF